MICIGYSPIEYDPVLWNGDRERRILHIDVLPADIDSSYCPTAELVGSIRANLLQLTRIMGNPKIRPPRWIGCCKGYASSDCDWRCGPTICTAIRFTPCVSCASCRIWYATT